MYKLSHLGGWAKLILLMMSLSTWAAVWKSYRRGSLQTTEMCFSQFWRLLSSRSKHWHGHMLIRPFSWFIASTLLLCPHVVEGTKDLSGASFTRAAVSLWGTHSDRRIWHLGNQECSMAWQPTAWAREAECRGWILAWRIARCTLEVFSRPWFPVLQK